MQIGIPLAVTRLGGGGTGGRFAPVFAPSALDLNDIFSATAAETTIRNSTATVLDYAGVLQTVAIDQHRVVGGRLSGGVWFDTNPSGGPLTPYRSINGAKWYDTKPDWTTGAWAAGSEVNNGGKWYSTVAGGTDTTTFGDGITWVEQGDYQRDFGVLAEETSTNSVSATNWRTAAMYSGSAVEVADQIGIDGAANTAVTITDNDNAAALVGTINTTCANDTATHTGFFFVKKNSGTQFPRLRLQVTGGTAVVEFASIDTATGEISAGSSASASVEDAGDFWQVKFKVTNNGTGNTTLSLYCYPAYSATLNGALDVTLTGSVVVDWPQIEQNTTISSSPIPGGTTRAEEMGNIKWADSVFPQPEGTMLLAWCPQFASGDLPTGSNRAIVTLDDSNSRIIYQQASATTNIAISDGTSSPAISIGAWSRGDVIEFALAWSTNANEMRLSYRNKSVTETWTHAITASYDGAFPATSGFLQLLKAARGNNSVFRNLPVILDRAISDAEIEVLVP